VILLPGQPLTLLLPLRDRLVTLSPLSRSQRGQPQQSAARRLLPLDCRLAPTCALWAPRALRRHLPPFLRARVSPGAPLPWRLQRRRRQRGLKRRTTTDGG
jgi:hypothetical protein